MRKILLLLALCALAGTAGAQSAVTVQPKIMVIPFTKEGEDIRTVLEDDVNKRIVLTKVKEAFDSRGFTTVDFFGRLKALSTTEALTIDNQADLKSMIIAGSGADIYVEAEIDILESASGNSVKVIITAYDISTGNSLSNKVGDSGKFYTDDYGKLASKAISGQMDSFLDVMQTKFNDICENGRSISVTIGFSESSAYSMTSEVGSEGYTLADEIELWMGDHAYQNNYHMQGSSDVQIIFDDVRIPMRDENGNNYNISKFGMEFLKFARSLGLRINRTITNNNLIITIE